MPANPARYAGTDWRGSRSGGEIGSARARLGARPLRVPSLPPPPPLFFAAGAPGVEEAQVAVLRDVYRLLTGELELREASGAPLSRSCMELAKVDARGAAQAGTCRELLVSGCPGRFCRRRLQHRHGGGGRYTSPVIDSRRRAGPNSRSTAPGVRIMNGRGRAHRRSSLAVRRLALYSKETLRSSEVGYLSAFISGSQDVVGPSAARPPWHPCMGVSFVFFVLCVRPRDRLPSDLVVDRPGLLARHCGLISWPYLMIIGLLWAARSALSCTHAARWQARVPRTRVGWRYV